MLQVDGRIPTDTGIPLRSLDARAVLRGLPELMCEDEAA